MASARKEIVNENEVGTYHCIARCVRRSFLCGFDNLTNKSFEHRKLWIENRIKHLSRVFVVDIGSYAVMSNHLHIVLKTRSDKIISFSDEEILNRWNLLYPKYRDKNGKVVNIPENELKLLLFNKERIQIVRERLSSISWFMKSLNEHIARKANFEDKCKGRFWESRFKCQLLLGDAAILACMAYVELNPIRAGLNEKLEDSKHTSITKRLKAYKAELRIENKAIIGKNITKAQQKLLLKEEKQRDSVNWLAPIQRFHPETFLNIDFKKYVELIEWTGKQIVSGKRGKIPIELESVITRFEIDNKQWVDSVKHYGSTFYRIVGKTEDIIKVASNAGKSWFWGMNNFEKNIIV